MSAANPLSPLPPDPAASHRFCVAPMMDWTDRHCRSFHRVLTRRARLYSEMLTSGAVLHGDRPHLMGFSEAEQPLALQLGGVQLLRGARQVPGARHAPEMEQVVEIELLDVHRSFFNIEKFG